MEESSSPFGFDQVDTACTGSSVERDTTRPKTGSASLRAHYKGEGCSPFARGIFRLSPPGPVSEGDEVRVTEAVFLPRGFYAAHDDYTDLLRLDSYVNDEGEALPDDRRQSLALASLSDDALSVRAGPGTSNQVTLIGPLPASSLPEERWHVIELAVRVSAFDGSALTELRINGVPRGMSRAANRVEGRADYNRARFGLVSASGDGSGDLTLYVDDASIRTGAASPSSLSTEIERRLAPLWRLVEDLLGLRVGAGRVARP